MLHKTAKLPRFPSSTVRRTPVKYYKHVICNNQVTSCSAVRCVYRGGTVAARLLNALLPQPRDGFAAWYICAFGESCPIALRTRRSTFHLVTEQR